MTAKGKSAMNYYSLKLPKRRARLGIEEKNDCVVFDLQISSYGDNFGDEQKIADWLADFVIKYEKDPRPIVMTHPLTGQIATVTDFGATIVTPSKMN